MSDKKNVFRSLAMVTQLGLSVVTPIFLCVFAGLWIDERFGTKFMIPLLILGVLSGARSAWLLVKHIQKADELEKEQQQNAHRGKSEARDFDKPKQPSRIRSASTGGNKETKKNGMAK